MEFSEANRGGILGSTFTAPVSGLLQANPASRDVWLSFLHFGTGTVFYGMTPYKENELLGVLRSRVEGWEVVASYGSLKLEQEHGIFVHACTDDISGQ